MKRTSAAVRVLCARSLLAAFLYPAVLGQEQSAYTRSQAIGRKANDDRYRQDEKRQVGTPVPPAARAHDVVERDVVSFCDFGKQRRRALLLLSPSGPVTARKRITVSNAQFLCDANILVQVAAIVRSAKVERNGRMVGPLAARVQTFPACTCRTATDHDQKRGQHSSCHTAFGHRGRRIRISSGFREAGVPWQWR